MFSTLTGITFTAFTVSCLTIGDLNFLWETQHSATRLMSSTERTVKKNLNRHEQHPANLTSSRYSREPAALKDKRYIQIDSGTVYLPSDIDELSSHIWSLFIKAEEHHNHSDFFHYEESIRTIFENVDVKSLLTGEKSYDLAYSQLERYSYRQSSPAIDNEDYIKLKTLILDQWTSLAKASFDRHLPLSSMSLDQLIESLRIKSNIIQNISRDMAWTPQVRPAKTKFDIWVATQVANALLHRVNQVVSQGGLGSRVIENKWNYHVKFQSLKGEHSSRTSFFAYVMDLAASRALGVTSGEPRHYFDVSGTGF